MRYRVTGCDRTTGQDIARVIEAPNADEARAIANRSMLTSEVELLPKADEAVGGTVVAPPAGQRKSKGNKSLIFAMAGLIVLIVAGGGGFLYRRSSQKDVGAEKYALLAEKARQLKLRLDGKVVWGFSSDADYNDFVQKEGEILDCFSNIKDESGTVLGARANAIVQRITSVNRDVSILGRDADMPSSGKPLIPAQLLPVLKDFLNEYDAEKEGRKNVIPPEDIDNR